MEPKDLRLHFVLCQMPILFAFFLWKGCQSTTYTQIINRSGWTNGSCSTLKGEVR